MLTDMNALKIFGTSASATTVARGAIQVRSQRQLLGEVFTDLTQTRTSVSQLYFAMTFHNLVFMETTFHVAESLVLAGILNLSEFFLLDHMISTNQYESSVAGGQSMSMQIRVSSFIAGFFYF